VRRSLSSHLAAQVLAALVAAIAATALSVDYSSAQERPRAGADQRQAPGAGRPAARRGEPDPDRPAARRPARKPAAKPPAPAPAPPDGDAEDNNERLGRDPFASLGGNSPFCRGRRLGAVERANCKASGALSHPHQITRYGFDVHIDTGVDNIAGNISAMLQSVVGLGWLGLLFVVKGVTLLLEWSFSLDLLSEAMAGVKQALGRLHRDVFGEAWFLAAISAAGLWAIWRGFVQRKTIQTATGLAATVALMVVALVIINNPADTVGRANQLANQSSLGIVSGATTGSVSGSASGFGEAMTRVFDQAVLRPWCAMEFSDVGFCMTNPRKAIPRDDLPDDPEIAEAWATSPTVADMFLAFEPNGEDNVDQRNQIYEEWKDNDGERLQAVVRMQKESATGPRIALFCLIAIGMLGMICLFGWIGLRLLGYAVMSLILVLFAPIALLMAAFGDSGRQSFVGWAKRLLGALIAKAVYAIFLALVLIASAALAELDSLGFIAVWLLQTVFWWTLFLKRDDIIGFASAPGLDTDKAHAGPGALQRLYYAQQGMRSAKALAGGVAATGIGGAKIAAKPATATAGGIQTRRAKTAQATAGAADQDAREQARERLERGHDHARDTVARDDEASEALARVDHGLRSYDERAETAKAQGAPAPVPHAREQVLLDRRAQLHAQRPPAADAAAAREQVRHADVNRARTGSAVSAEDERAEIARRRQEIATLPATHDANLQAAGIDPATYRQAGAAGKERLARESAESLEREAAILGAVSAGGAGAGAPKRSELRRARRALGRDQVREVRSQDNAQRRAQRRAARQRARLDPRRPR